MSAPVVDPLAPLVPAPASPLARVFGLRAPVSRASYVVVGATLMAIKFGVESLVIYRYTGRWLSVWDFINPLLEDRAELLQGTPGWLGPALIVWSLPFLWVALSMSVRRAADAFGSAALGLLVLLPLVNLATMVGLSLAPSRPRRPRNSPAPIGAPLQAALWGMLAGLGIGLGSLALSVFALGIYGATRWSSPARSAARGHSAPARVLPSSGSTRPGPRTHPRSRRTLTHAR